MRMSISKTRPYEKIAILFFLALILHFAKEFLIPLAIGGIFATVLLPLNQWLESKRVPKGLAATMCVLSVALALTAISLLLAWQLFELVNDLSLVKEMLVKNFNKAQQYIRLHFAISDKEQLLVLKDQQASVTDALKNMAASLTNMVTQTILIFVYIFCFIYYRTHIGNFMVMANPGTQKKELEKSIHRSARVSQQYLLGLAKMIGILWVLYFIAFSLLGVKNALFLAILCGLLEIIPYIGNLVGTSLTLLVSAVNGGSWAMLGGIALTYGVVQLFQGWVLEPRIVGAQVKINPFSTIIALIIGNFIWGIPGIFLAIPITAILKTVFDSTDSLHAYGYLIGDPAILEKEKNRMEKPGDL